MKPDCVPDMESKLKNIVKGKKLLILCVGNPIRGDDGAPHLLFRKLKGNVARLRLLDCGTSPQDYMDQAVRLKPDIVIFVNSIDRSLEPGSIVLDELHQTSSIGSSLIGHRVPLAWVASLLKIMGEQRNLTIETILIGIQICSAKGRVTVPVRKSVNKLIGIFTELDSVAEAFTS
jgi:hydrogenase maturation protease